MQAVTSVRPRAATNAALLLRALGVGCGDKQGRRTQSNKHLCMSAFISSIPTCGGHRPYQIFWCDGDRSPSVVPHADALRRHGVGPRLCRAGWLRVDAYARREARCAEASTRCHRAPAADGRALFLRCVPHRASRAHGQLSRRLSNVAPCARRRERRDVTPGPCGRVHKRGRTRGGTQRGGDAPWRIGRRRTSAAHCAGPSG
jgi:hypothetical protein